MFETLEPTETPQNPQFSQTAIAVNEQSFEDSLTPTERKVLDLLGQGVTATQTSTTLGISESRISQLMSEDMFRAKVQERRFSNLQKVNKIDATWDDIELKAVKKLAKLLDSTYSFKDVSRVAQLANMAKRRGQSTPEHIQTATTVVQLTLPTIIHRKFTKNINNQVLEVSDSNGKITPLITVSPGELQKLTLEAAKPGAEKLTELEMQERYQDERAAKVRKLTGVSGNVSSTNSSNPSPKGQGSGRKSFSESEI